MQTKKQSLVEQIVSTIAAFIISVLVWQFIVKPTWSLKTDFIENLNITLLFTVVSFARGYATRRFFNWLHKNNNNSHEKLNRNNGKSPER